MVDKQWINKNVDLPTLIEQIKYFLSTQGLRIRQVESNETGRSLLVDGKWGGKTDPRKARLHRRRRITISIKGTANDFTVKMDTSNIEKGFRSSRTTGSLLSLFGGGALLLESVKAQEAFHFWQEQFWRFVTAQVDKLFNSQLPEE